MKNNNIKAATIYRLKENRNIAAIFFLVIIALSVFSIVTALRANAGTSSMSAFGMAASITIFVTGICAVREHLRLCLQLGAGRPTAFISELIAAVITSIALSLIGEVILAVCQAIVAGRDNIVFSDMYQVLYIGMDARTMTFGQHLLSAAFNTSLCLSGYAAGAFLSLLFYRLSKIWRIVVAVGIPVLIIFGIPGFIAKFGFGSQFSQSVMDFMEWIGKSAGNFILLFVGIAIIFAAINWLLMRRAPVTVKKG